MQSARAEIQHLAKEPTKDKRSKDNKEGDNPTEEKSEVGETIEKEPEEGKEPIAHNYPQPIPTTPPLCTTGKPQAIVAPYPLKYGKKEAIKEQNKKFEGYLTQMEINVPLKDMLQISPPFHKYVKILVGGKLQLPERGNIMLTEECSALLQKTLPRKCKDPGSFTVPCTIGGVEIGRALCDLGASVNLMPLSIMKKLNCGEAKPTRMTLILADRTK
ncbi:hypothetical protein A2U01_0030568, partial [Trifolium medium]|nr:hypothetical protein [Trifolium medium]